MDGLIYDCIGRNMAEGIGSIWHPSYTATYQEQFYGHPTLAMYLLSLCYRIAGEGIWVCRTYSLLMFVITGLLMLRLWQRVGGNSRNGWLPLLLWIAIQSVTHFSYSNLLEVSMAPFVLSAVLMSIRAYHQDKTVTKAIDLLLGGALLGGAFFVKGFTGLYPLGLPMLLSLVAYNSQYEPRWGERLWQGCKDSVLITIGCAGVIGAVLWLNEPARDYIVRYIQIQVIDTIDKPTVDNRFYIVRAFFERTIIVWVILGLTLTLRFTARQRNYDLSFTQYDQRLVTALSLLVMCGVLPIMASVKQSSFYILTVYPYFSVVAAMVIQPTIDRMLAWRTRKTQWACIAVAVLMLGGGVAYQAQAYGQPDRDVEMQTDAWRIYPKLEKGERVAIDESMNGIYSLHGYYYRDHHVSLDANDKDSRCRHLILTDAEQLLKYGRDTLYTEIPLQNTRYKLYEKKKIQQQ